MSDRTTIFSPCRRYRYKLWREWDVDSLTGCCDDLAHPDEYLMVIGLNPSTADEAKDDPTIRKCIGFAKRLGYGALCMTNLFAFRATDPRAMKREANPIGSDNDLHLKVCAENAGLIVAAWGVNGAHLRRNKQVFDLIEIKMRTVCCLRKTKSGHPEHPLYVPYDARPVSYNDIDLLAAK